MLSVIVISLPPFTVISSVAPETFTSVVAAAVKKTSFAWVIFKSVNASIVGSINYILSLSSNVKKDYMLYNVDDILTIDDAINSIFKLFVNDKNIDEKSKKTRLQGRTDAFAVGIRTFYWWQYAEC